MREVSAQKEELIVVFRSCGRIAYGRPGYEKSGKTVYVLKTWMYFEQVGCSKLVSPLTGLCWSLLECNASTAYTRLQRWRFILNAVGLVD